MGLVRGFFRLWLLATVVWIGVMTWLFYDQIFYCVDGDIRSFFDNIGLPMNCENATKSFRRSPIHAIVLIVVPPAALLLFGCAVGWVVRGFRAPMRRS